MGEGGGLRMLLHQPDGDGLLNTSIGLARLAYTKQWNANKM